MGALTGHWDCSTGSHILARDGAGGRVPVMRCWSCLSPPAPFHGAGGTGHPGPCGRLLPGALGMSMDLHQHRHLEAHSPSRGLAALPTHSSACAWSPTAIAQALALPGALKPPPTPCRGGFCKCATGRTGGRGCPGSCCLSQGCTVPAPHGAAGGSAGAACCKDGSTGAVGAFPAGSLPGAPVPLRGRRAPACSAGQAACTGICVCTHVQSKPARCGHVCVRVRACAVHAPYGCACIGVCTAHAVCARAI